MSNDAHLVTQMIWGKTTHVGCGWTQFLIKETRDDKEKNPWSIRFVIPVLHGLPLFFKKKKIK